MFLLCPFYSYSAHLLINCYCMSLLFASVSDLGNLKYQVLPGVKDTEHLQRPAPSAVLTNQFAPGCASLQLHSIPVPRAGSKVGHHYVAWLYGIR